MQEVAALRSARSGEPLPEAVRALEGPPSQETSPKLSAELGGGSRVWGVSTPLVESM